MIFSQTKNQREDVRNIHKQRNLYVSKNAVLLLNCNRIWQKKEFLYSNKNVVVEKTKLHEFFIINLKFYPISRLVTYELSSHIAAGKTRGKKFLNHTKCDSRPKWSQEAEGTEAHVVNCIRQGRKAVKMNYYPTTKNYFLLKVHTVFEWNLR